MNYYFNKTAQVLSVAGLLFWNACKDPNTAGLEVLPANDALNVVYSDTASLITFTVREDSLTSTNNSANLAGTCIDNIFGLSRAGFYTKLTPLKLSPNFGVEPQADSVVLSLGYLGEYGDTSEAVLPQRFNVYQVTEDIIRDTIYYSSRKIAYGTLTGSEVFTPNIKDSVLVEGQKEAPQLRLRLDTAFFRNYILSQSGQVTLGSVTAFQNYFKGIYVTPDTTNTVGNRILYFNLASTVSKLKIYYHNEIDTGVYDLNMDIKTTSVSVNHFYHNYVGTPVEMQLIDSNLGNSQVFVQAMAGLKTKIKFPFLKNYNDIGRIAINKAELMITVDQTQISGYHPASQLAVQGIDSAGVSVFTADYFESIDFRGGEYDATSGVYKTNITRHIQNVLTGKTEDYGLYLVVYGGSVFANRSVMFGGGPFVPGRMKLQITYSLLN